MSEQNVDGTQDGDSLATDSSSGATPSQEASTAETLLKRIEELEKRDRDLQGKLDKDAYAIEKRLSNSFDTRLKELGITLSPEQQTKKELQDLREQLASVGQGDAKPQPQTVKEPQRQPVNIAAIKQAYSDIDFNRPEVLEAVSKNLNNEEGLLVALGKIKVSGTAKPKPTAASVTTPAGSGTASETMEDLQAEYNALLQDPVSFKKPENKKRREEIIKRMEEKENV